MCNRNAYYQNYGHARAQHRRRKAEKWAHFQAFRQGFASVPVNVQELDDRFELHLFAAGYTKKDFKLSIVDNILSISVDKKEAETPENATWRRKEYLQKGFVREFELNGKINAEAIAATYTDGVLRVTLPKKEGEETLRQDIKIK